VAFAACGHNKTAMASSAAQKGTGFHPVIILGERWEVLDLSKGYHPETISLDPPSIGRYNEARKNMYTTGLFKGVRNIHMGVDIWVPEGTPVFSFAEGRVLFFRDNDQPGDYGPTIVTEHIVALDGCEPSPLYALFGHLCRKSLEDVSEGMALERGQCIAEVGGEHENGGWVPHLHFQLSRKRPVVPDMPGVVAPEDRDAALRTYPDPQIVLGPLY
jgi:peptidoglycan LD-endopeptidase LytH